MHDYVRSYWLVTAGDKVPIPPRLPLHLLVQYIRLFSSQDRYQSNVAKSNDVIFAYLSLVSYSSKNVQIELLALQFFELIF